MQKLALGRPNRLAYPLTVSGTAGTNQHQAAVEFSNGVPDTGVRIRNTTVGGKTWTIFSSGTGSGIGAGNFNIFDVDQNINRVSITPSGNVGIGASPGARLHVAGGDAAVTTQGNGLILRAT